MHVIGFSDLRGLWVIKIKSLWSFAHVLRGDHVNRARNAALVANYSQTNEIVRLPNLQCFQFDLMLFRYISIIINQTWQTHFRKVCKGLWASLEFAFGMLIGWPDEVWSCDAFNHQHHVKSGVELWVEINTVIVCHLSNQNTHFLVIPCDFKVGRCLFVCLFVCLFTKLN